MKIELSDRINRLKESDTIKMASLARDLKAQGKAIISLSLGEPDFNTPDFIKEGAKQAIDQNYSKYSPIAGYPELLTAICTKLKEQNNLDYTEKQIVVSTGAKQSLANLFMCIVNHGDEVIIPAPYWVTYPELANLSGGKSVFIETTIESDFKITPEQLEQAITPKSKLFIFSSPSNPTGSVYSEEEIKALAKVFEKHPQVLIVSDEIYEHICFDTKPFSLAAIPSLKDRVVVINGFSKSYAMTGWRLGYLAAPEYIAKATNKLQGQYTSGTCSIAQRAAITAYNGSFDEIEKMRQVFKTRRDMAYQMLSEIEGLKVNLPKGAFYFFPEVSSFFGKSDGETTINNSSDLALYILNKGCVATVAGSSFGAEGYLRLSYANSDEQLKQAFKNMKEVLALLK